MFGRKIDTGIGGLGAYNPHLDTKTVTRESEPLRDGEPIDYWYTYAVGLQEQVKGLVDNRDTLYQIAIERKANDAGLRAVVRYLLAELRKSQPNHPLLDKKNRDRIFNEFAKAEMEKMLAKNGDEPWEPRRPEERQSE